MLERLKSSELFKKASEVIANGVNSPIRAFAHLQMDPLVAAKGQKAWILDEDGHWYLDFCGSWGALLHGHAHPKITKKVIERVKNGSTFGLLTASEEKLARKICTLMPSIEQIRFVSSGTEATMSAIRLARGATKRTLVVKFEGHYHGHGDSFLVKAGSGVAFLAGASSEGVPQDFIRHTICLPYNDFEAVNTLFRTQGSLIAAVILEPIAANMGVVPPEPGFLELLRKKTEEVGALLIFDEVITGFRVAKGGAQQLYGITPDLTCLGKIIGGGYPAAAFGGKREWMEHLAPKGGVYQAGTLSGNPVAMEAGYEALSLLDQPSFYEQLEEKITPFYERIEKQIRDKNVSLQKVGSMFTLFLGAKKVTRFSQLKTLDPILFQSFFQKLFSQGIYFSCAQQEANFISAVHSEKELKKAAQTICKALDGIH